MFWPDVLDESARSSLRTTLATLRRELGPAAADVITATRERIGIEPGPEVSIDLRAFEELVSRGELQEAATLCRGELLADLDDEWVYEARESHRRQSSTYSVGWRTRRRAPETSTLALDRNREQVALDPLSEEAQGDLIRRLATAGDRAGALAAYKAYGARLRRDLGIAPSAGIRELAEGVRSGSSQPAGNGAGPGAPERTPPEVHYERCADCGHENAPDRRFCGSCGHALFQVCPSCGEESPSRVDFCGACGSQLTPSGRVAAALEGERRWATVLFGDLAGFTHLSETTDPEDVRLMIDRCTSQMGEIVDRYGGWIDKVIGDALMAVFGAPVAHEDDAERAVRAGLELQRYAAENADDLGGLALRVGVDSGEVMFAPVGPEDRRELTVMGDTVNTAWRLQEVAPQGSVLIGDQTRSACRKAIRCEAVAPIAVKGKDAPARGVACEGSDHIHRPGGGLERPDARTRGGARAASRHLGAGRGAPATAARQRARIGGDRQDEAVPRACPTRRGTGRSGRARKVASLRGEHRLRRARDDDQDGCRHLRDGSSA